MLQAVPPTPGIIARAYAVRGNAGVFWKLLPSRKSFSPRHTKPTPPMPTREAASPFRGLFFSLFLPFIILLLFQAHRNLSKPIPLQGRRLGHVRCRGSGGLTGRAHLAI